MNEPSKGKSCLAGLMAGLLCLQNAPLFAEIVKKGGGPKESGIGFGITPPMSWPDPTPQQSAPLSLYQSLASLSPLEQLEKLEELSATSPAARAAAAVIAEPELADPGGDLAYWAAALHIEARSDERVRAKLDALTHLAAAGSWRSAFDGTAASMDAVSSEGTRFAPALVWPVGDDPGYQRRVHALGARGEDILINGKRAERFQDKRVEGGVLKESFVHPDDPGLIVKVYQGPGMEAFEHKSARIESLGPLSAAGAAPKVIEHGEAAVSGRGRVYFYVQELVRGRSLRQFVPEGGVLDAAGALFERMKQAGIALIVPDREWLLAHMVLGETASGGAGAYVMGGKVETAGTPELSAHYDMLLSALRSLPATIPYHEGDLHLGWSPAVASQAQERLAALDANADMKSISVEAADPGKRGEVLKRHGLPAAAGSLLRLKSDSEVYSAAEALLADPHVARVKVHPAIKAYLDRRGGKALYEMIRSLSKSERRNQLILKIPGSVYAKMESAYVASILELVAKRENGNWTEVYSKVPQQAWEKIEVNDLNRLLARWLDYGMPAVAALIAQAWFEARVPEQMTGKELDEILALFSETSDKEPLRGLIHNLPKYVYAQMAGADVAAAIERSFLGQDVGYYKEIPQEAWRRMSREDVVRLIGKALEKNLESTPSVIAGFWFSVHYQDRSAPAGQSWKDLSEFLRFVPGKKRAVVIDRAWPIISRDASGKDLFEMLSHLAAEMGDKRDELASKLPTVLDGKTSGQDLAALVGLLVNHVSSADAFDRVPGAVWAGMSRQDVEPLVKEATAKKLEATPARIAKQWMKAHHPERGAAGTAWVDMKALLELLAGNKSTAELVASFWPIFGADVPVTEILKTLSGLPESSNRDRIILSISGSVYDAMPGGEIARVLELVSKEGEGTAGTVYNKIPREAWEGLRREDVDHLLARWSSVQYLATIKVVGDHCKKTRINAEGRDLRKTLAALPKSNRRDEKIVLVDSSAYVKMESRDVLAILELAEDGKKVYEGVADAAWRRLAQADIDNLIKRWASHDETANLILERWMKARQAPDRSLPESLMTLPESHERDQMILKLTGENYEAMSGEEIADVLALVSKEGENREGTIYKTIPKEAWQGMNQADVDRLIARWAPIGYNGTIGVINKLWPGPASSYAKDRKEFKDLRAVLERAPKSARRDEMILLVGEAAYAKMTSPEVFAVLAMAHDGVKVYESVPNEAWKKLGNSGLDRLLLFWKQDEKVSDLIQRRWIGAHGK